MTQEPEKPTSVQLSPVSYEYRISQLPRRTVSGLVLCTANLLNQIESPGGVCPSELFPSFQYLAIPLFEELLARMPQVRLAQPGVKQPERVGTTERRTATE